MKNGLKNIPKIVDLVNKLTFETSKKLELYKLLELLQDEHAEAMKNKKPSKEQVIEILNYLRKDMDELTDDVKRMLANSQVKQLQKAGLVEEVQVRLSHFR